MKMKSQLAPKGLQFNPADFVISGKYAMILTAVSYPRVVDQGYLSDLTNISGVKVVIKHIPVSSAILHKMLNNELVELRQRYQVERDNTVLERLRQDMESLETFIQQYTASQSRSFDFQLHIMITANTREELNNRRANLKAYLDSMELVAIPLRFEQERVLKSMLPIFGKQIVEERIGNIMPSPTMATMYPFIFDSLKDEGLATLLGVEFSGGVVLFNQFLYQIKKENNRNSANMIILGATGSGKSTAAKLLLRSHIRNNYQIVCVDPEAELTEMTLAYGGEVIDLGKGGAYGMINPLEIVMDTDDDAIQSQGLGYTILTTNLQNLKAFMKYYSPSIEEDVLTLFGEIVLETYARFGIAYNTDFSHYTSKDFPIMQDVYVTVTSKLTSMTEKTHERDVLERLELKLRPLVKELQYYFNGHTTIDVTNRYLVFNIKDVMNSAENVRDALLFNVLKYAWSLCLNPNVNTILNVDEAHVLLGSGNELGAQFLAQVQRRARKYNTGTIIITQQPSDFVANNMIMHGKAIFDNASYYLVMGLRKDAANDLARLIDLNDNEIENIKRYNQGEGLFVCGSRRMQIDVTLTDDELESFGSGGGL